MPDSQDDCCRFGSFFLTGQSPLKQADDIAADNIQAGIVAQQTIDALDEETRKAFLAYRSLLQRNTALENYNRQLERLLENQQAEIQQKQNDIGRAKNFERDILPLIGDMITTLERLIKEDLPFLVDERQTVVAELRELMSRADVSTSEKFRQVIAAYQDESDFGRTIESFRGEVSLGGDKRLVDFLRVGRNILLYQSLDREHHALWNDKAGHWQPISNSWRRGISHALQIARKQSAPDLLILPTWGQTEEALP